MTISEIRRANVRALIGSDRGRQADIARRASMSDSQLSQILSETNPKNIGNLIARRLESVFAVSRGWLDTPHSDEELHAIQPKACGEIQQQTEVIIPFTISPEEIALVNAYRRSTAAGKLSIRAAADASQKLD